MRKYHVAFSFAGEEREYVEKVFLSLKEESNLRVFYDRDNDIALWGKNLVEVFQDIYTKEAHFVVMFVSKNYIKKAFPRQEKRFALDRAIENVEEYILPARFDDSEVDGIPKTTAYIDLRNLDHVIFAQMIIDKITQKGLYFGDIFNENSHSEKVRKNTPAETILTTKDEKNSPIADIDVRLFRKNETHRSQKSNSNGRVVFEDIAPKEIHTIFLAHPDFPAVIVDNFENNFDLEITIFPKQGVGSAIFEGTGYIPDFQGRLNPILDSSTYLYADNIAINGSVDGQPRYFTFGENISLEDCEGNVVDIRILRIVGDSAILDYIVHK